MKTKEIYVYMDNKGRMVHSITKPEDTPYDIEYRIIAETGRVISDDGIVFRKCADTSSTDGWREFDDLTKNLIEESEAE